jgi:hypothetical protein
MYAKPGAWTDTVPGEISLAASPGRVSPPGPGPLRRQSFGLATLLHCAAGRRGAGRRPSEEKSMNQSTAICQAEVGKATDAMVRADLPPDPRSVRRY